MRISYIKAIGDKKSFKMVKGLGMEVYELDDLEKIDDTIAELVKNNCHTIIMTNEIAGFSESIIRKYNKSENVNIFITPSTN